MTAPERDRSTRWVHRLRSFGWSSPEGRRVVGLLVVAVLVLAGGLTVITVRTSPGIREGQARLRPDGVVEVSLARAGFVSITHDTTLSVGDAVRVTRGTAVLELPHRSVVELRAGSGIELGSSRDDAAVTLQSGDALVEVREGTVAVDGGSALVTVGSGAAKLRRSASLVAGVYEGSLLLAGTGQSLSVGALRQAAVAGTGRLPDAVRPLMISENDSWDRRFLGQVLQLDQRLMAFGRGFEALLSPSEASDPSFYRQALPSLADAPLTADFLAQRSGGENLVGLSIVSLTEGPFKQRLDEVFGLRGEGARWGLVAADRDLSPPKVVQTIEAAIGRAPLQLAAPGSGPGSTPTTPGGPGPSTPGTTSPGGGGGGGTTSTTGPSGSGTTTTTFLATLPTTTVTTQPTPTTTPSPVTTTTCGLLGGLLGGC